MSPYDNARGGNAILAAAMMAALLCLTGCRPAGFSQQDANTTDASVVETPTAPVELLDAVDPESDDPSEPKIADGQTAAGEGDSEQTIQGTKHRILVFPPDGPLLVEFDIAVAGRPLDGWIDTILNEALNLANNDQDGRVTWDELYESDELENRYFSESSVLDLGLDETKRRYDVNKNDLVDRYELPKLLTGGMSSGQSFGLRGSNYYREINRYASPLFRYLDRDSSGSLSSDEISDSAARLCARDFDNDEFVGLSDLSLRDVNDGEMRNNAYQPHVAVWLGPRNPWDAIRLALTELYADGDMLSAGHLTLTPELFGQLDADQNGRLSLRELAALTELPPHVAITVRLSSQNKNTPVISNVALCDSLQRADVRIQVDPPRLMLQLPTSRIDLYVRDMLMENPTARADELLEQVDNDKNQYVDLQEYKAAEVEWEREFAELDTDGNEMIFVDELASLFQSRQELSGSQVRVRASHRPDALFSALDANGDGRLAPQELDAVGQAIIRLDADHDGRVTPNELPDYLVVGLTQGGDQQANELLSQLPIAKVTSAAPDWFQAMDHNGDGQLSPREFLGKTLQFNQLDTDEDGYLTVDETIR